MNKREATWKLWSVFSVTSQIYMYSIQQELHEVIFTSRLCVKLLQRNCEMEKQNWNKISDYEGVNNDQTRQIQHHLYKCVHLHTSY